MPFLWLVLLMCTVKQNITCNLFFSQLDSYGRKKMRSRGKKKTDQTLFFKRAKQFFMHLLVQMAKEIRSVPETCSFTYVTTVGG